FKSLYCGSGRVRYDLDQSQSGAKPGLARRSLRSSVSRSFCAARLTVRRGTPQAVEELTGHSLIGFTQRESLSHRPLRHPLARACSTPSLWASSDEAMRQLALACLSSCTTAPRVRWWMFCPMRPWGAAADPRGLRPQHGAGSAYRLVSRLSQRMPGPRGVTRRG